MALAGFQCNAILGVRQGAGLIKGERVRAHPIAGFRNYSWVEGSRRTHHWV